MSLLRRASSRSRPSAESNENALGDPSDLIPLPPARTPLNSILDPSQNPRDGQLLESLKGTGGTTPRSVPSTPSRVPSRAGHGTGSRHAVNAGVREKGGSSRALRSAAADVRSWSLVQAAHFQLEPDPSFWRDHNVQVLIRIRPISGMETGLQGYGSCLKQESSKTLTWTGHPETRFTFDHIACDSISQEELFKVVGVPMVENCMSGYNSCMFAYGQTGSGKTYTMMGEISEMLDYLSEDRGMTPRIFEYLFKMIQEEENARRDEKLEYNCKCSFLEIYNEQITDLLDPTSTNLQLREDLKKGVYVENLRELEVHTVNDVLRLLLKGSANRKMAATNMNSESSRSHSLFTCTIESRWEKDNMTLLRFSRLNLVDLAGSERQKSSGAEGERLKEAANINRSLSTLGLVIMTLVDIANGKHRHVPYRDSRLTFLLQDSLGGNSKTTIIANISPSICSAHETLSTLKFAQRAKLIQNNAKVNEDASGDVMALQRQIRILKDQLTFLNKHQNIPMPLCCSPKNYKISSFGEFLDDSDFSLTRRLEDPVIRKPKEPLDHLKTALISSLRREKVAEDAMRSLEMENEHLNRLVCQWEEDVQRTTMMVNLRDEKIRRLELLADGLMSTDRYIMEENDSLSKEIQLLQGKIDQNPELTRLALENVRLTEQLRVFEQFCQQEERELLMGEVSELRNQILKVAEGEYWQTEVATSKTSQEDRSADLDTFSSSKFHDTIEELKVCKKRLNACLEENARLTREIEDLNCQLQQNLNFKDYAAYTVSTSADGVDCMQEREKDSHDTFMLVAADNEVTREKVASDAGSERGLEWRGLENAVLYTELDKMHQELEEARVLIKQLQHDHASSRSMQHEMENVQQQVEVETAKTIIYLQEELSRLQVVNARDRSCSSNAMDTEPLRMENQVLHDRLYSITQENNRLLGLLSSSEAETSAMAEEWEKAVVDLTNFLVDGRESLEDASDQIEVIMDSFPQGKAWVNEHVERAIMVFLEKERLIFNLQKQLEEAQKVEQEMISRLHSLRGATLAMAEYQQLENDETARELLHLRELLDEKASQIQKLESMTNTKENNFLAAEKHLAGSFTDSGNLNARGTEQFVTLKENLVVKEYSRLSQEYMPSKALSEIPLNDDRYHAVDTTNTHLSDNTDMVEMQKVLQRLERKMEETDSDYSQTTMMLHRKLSDATAMAEEKRNQAARLLLKFAEAQQTIEEAELTINALLKLNESIKQEKNTWKERSEGLLTEKHKMTTEIQELKASTCSIEGDNGLQEHQIRESLAEALDTLSLVEGSFHRTQEDAVEGLKAIYSDILAFGHDLLDCISTSRSWIEALMSNMMKKDFAFFVICQCHTGAFAELMARCQWEPNPAHHQEHEPTLFDGKNDVSARSDDVQKRKKTSETPGKVHKQKLDICSQGRTFINENIVDSELNDIFDPRYCCRGNIKLGESEIATENLFLRKELARKDTLLKGLFFDFRLLQESSSNAREIRDETQQMISVLSQMQHEIASKTAEVDALVAQQKKLQSQLADRETLLSNSRSELNKASETLMVYMNENTELQALLEDVSAKHVELENQLKDKNKVIDGLEREVLCINSSVEEKILYSVEEVENELNSVCNERDHLLEEVAYLKDKLESANALADENEAIAVEACQVAEVNKIFAEQKEEEVKVLENSIMELEETVNVLERKVFDMVEEVESSQLVRGELEEELRTLRKRIQTLETSIVVLDMPDVDIGQGMRIPRQVEAIISELHEARQHIEDLEKEKGRKAEEIKQHKKHISELVLHSEAQSSLYRQKFKMLEAMVSEAKGDPSTSSLACSHVNKPEKGSVRSRGSGSPFKCISTLVQQMNSEKEQELSEARHHIEELEAVAANRQKEVCMLTTRLAEVDNMTHDVIRDLLEVKLDLTNYANLIDQNQLQKLLQRAEQKNEENIVKDQEFVNLRKQIDNFVEERDSLLDEVNRLKAEILAARVTVERVQQRDQLLTAQNEMLKVDKGNLTLKISELDATLKRLVGSQSIRELIHQRNIIMENNSRTADDEFTRRLAEADRLLNCTKDEVTRVRKSKMEAFDLN